MSIVPEDVPPPPPTKPKLPAEERRRRWEERLAALRLRMAIGRELDERGHCQVGGLWLERSGWAKLVGCRRRRRASS